MRALAVSTLLVISGLWAIWWMGGPSSNEYVSYRAMCFDLREIKPPLLMESLEKVLEEPKQRDGCEIVSLSRELYKINFYTGEVYYDSSFWGAMRLVNCAIIDSNNWSCEYPDNSSRVVVVNGLLATGSNNVKNFMYFYLYRWQYWIATFHQFFGFGNLQGLIFIPEQKGYL